MGIGHDQGANQQPATMMGEQQIFEWKPDGISHQEKFKLEIGQSQKQEE